jgi:hypothetical protein
MVFVPLVAAGFFPLDEELELLPGSLTPALQEVLTRLGVWAPFEEAAQMLTDFMGLTSVSEATVRRHTEQAGAAYVSLQEQAVEQLEKGQERAPSEPILGKAVMQPDGAMVPLVKGEWAEAKTVVIGEAQETVEADGERQVALQQISSFSRLTDCEDFCRQSLIETFTRGVAQAAEVGVVSDGAEWIQGFTDYHQPEAVRILDFAHAAQYVAAIGQGVYGEGTSAGQEWLAEQLHSLKQEGASRVLPGLRALVREPGERPEMREALAYLEKRESQMQYGLFTQQGWPIGSGAIESANKLVVEARLKGAGMHWARGHVNPMLALRNIVCSDRWQKTWPQIETHLREQAAERRKKCRQSYRREQPPAGPVGKPDIIQATKVQAAVRSKGESQAGASSGTLPPRRPYRPAPDHPWRHSPLGRTQYKPLSYSSFTKF